METKILRKELKSLFLREGIKRGKIQLSLLAEEVSQEVEELGINTNSTSYKLKSVASQRAASYGSKSLDRKGQAKIMEEKKLEAGNLVQLSDVDGWSEHLTLGVDYAVQSVRGNLIYVIDDSGVSNAYIAARFILVKPKLERAS